MARENTEIAAEDSPEPGDMVRLGSTDCPEKALTPMQVRCIAQAQAELVRLLAGAILRQAGKKNTESSATSVDGPSAK
ncbi:hypothetical protein LCGC14_1563680 [marine sediment metagenome]|uniref:Uncharacterized protein n=1 Tax=marine sediment metagenome TaxID=412755 RepID=A0A0F9ILS1_9ZZZZ